MSERKFEIYSFDKCPGEEVHDNVYKFEKTEPWPGSEIIDNFKMTPEQENEAREEISKWDGVIEIFVHPYYFYADSGDNYYADGKKPEDKTENIYESVKAFLLNPPEKRPPLFFMEEARMSHIFERLIRPYNRFKVYEIPTLAGTSEPFVGDNISSDEGERSNSPAWNALRNKLFSLGVKTIFVNGIYLKVDVKGKQKSSWSPQVNEESTKSGCISGALEGLSFGDSFDVKLGELTFPHGRKEIAEAGFNKWLPKTGPKEDSKE